MVGQAEESLSPRRRQALAELREWRERMTDPELIAAADIVIEVLARGEGDSPPACRIGAGLLA